VVRAAVSTVVVIAVLVAVAVAMLWLFQRRLIYFPDSGPVPRAASVISGARDVVLETSDGLRLGAWYVPPRQPDAMTVLVANGNAGNRASRAPLAQALSDRGFGVLLFDYRGYGGNPGSPSEAGLALDARAAYDYLVDEAGVPARELVYFGESLGGGVVTALAVERPPAAIVLRSPFVDLASVGQEHYPLLPVGLLLRDRFPVAEQVAGIDVPVSVVYGSADSVVPAEQSRRVAESAPNLWKLVVVPNADHNDPRLVYGGPVVAAVVGIAAHVDHPRS
jgi:fermentation-respiration switch protein FrsA (DUF1100 family)